MSGAVVIGVHRQGHLPVNHNRNLRVHLIKVLQLPRKRQGWQARQRLRMMLMLMLSQLLPDLKKMKEIGMLAAGIGRDGVEDGVVQGGDLRTVTPMRRRTLDLLDWADLEVDEHEILPSEVLGWLLLRRSASILETRRAVLSGKLAEIS